MNTNYNFECYLFPDDVKNCGYRVFSDKMENDPNIFFHGTALKNLDSILSKGFVPIPPLESVSYTGNSPLALQYATNHTKGVIIVVRFSNLAARGLDIGVSIAYTNINPQSGKREEPTIVGICKIPCEYRHT